MSDTAFFGTDHGRLPWCTLNVVAHLQFNREMT